MRIGCMECGAFWSCTTPVMTCPECGAGETFVDDRGIQAAQHVDALSLSIAGAAITASAPSRTLAGPLVRYGVPGRTSRGMLRVRPGALRFPEDLGRVKLTREHDRNTSRGFLTQLHDTTTEMRVAVQASSGPEGDDALREAQDRTRDAFSFDVVDATIDGDEITDALVIAIGQVGIPAYDDARIDTIAASNHTGEVMTPEQRARLAELAAMNSRTPEQETEFADLQAAAVAEVTREAPAEEPAPAEAPAAPAAVAASAVTASATPAVPAGVPAPTSTTTTRRRGTALQQVVEDITAALNPSNGNTMADITAALADITHTAQSGNIEQPQWVGELWSGLEYEPEWSDLFAQDTLTHYEGKGWRFVQKLAIADYAGDKAAIPTGTVTTEPVEWVAARMAVGVDVDRKFYDFPNQGLVEDLVKQVRESWEIQKDAKVRAFVLANAVAGTRTAQVTTTAASTTVTAATGTFSAADVGATITGTGIPAAATIAAHVNSGQVTISAAATATGTVTATIGAQAGTLLKAAARLSIILKRRRVGRASWIVVNDEDLFTLLDVAEKDVPAFLELWGIDAKNFRSSPDVPRGTVVGGARQSAKWRQLPGSPIRVSAQHLANGGVDEAFFGYWAIEEHHNSGIATVQYKQPA